MDAVAQHERALAERLRTRLAEVPGLAQLALWRGDAVDRVGVAPFNLDGYRHVPEHDEYEPLVAAAAA